MVWAIESKLSAMMCSTVPKCFQVVRDSRNFETVYFSGCNQIIFLIPIITADVVIFNNVFEFFTNCREKQEVLWSFVRKTCVKPGTIIVTIPSLQNMFDNAGIGSIDIGAWLEELPLPAHEGQERDIDDEDDFASIYAYVVRDTKA